jgi:hypothetical protein
MLYCFFKETMIFRAPVLSTDVPEQIFKSVTRAPITPARRHDVEATINRVPAARPIESALVEWLHANRRLALSMARGVWEALIATSRGALLVKNGSRPRRRF